MTITVGLAEPGRLEGLSDAAAARLLAEHGPNLIQPARRRSLTDIAVGTVRQPMILLLLSAAGLYLVLGDLGEGLFLFGGALASAGLIVFQEARSERALQALRSLAEPNARVLRGGQERRVRASELVPGDLVLVGEGERLPADAVLVSGDALSVDESALTGESASVTKRPLAPGEAAEDAEPGGEGNPLVFAGTMLVRGQGVVRVLRTGGATRIGRIGASLAEIQAEPTQLQKSTGKLIALMGGFALVSCALVIVAYGMVRGDWVQGALSGLTIAISLIPEEYPMVLAVFLALGAWRLARRKVLVRKAAATEALGAITMLCVDKTGTLTENRMVVAALWRDGQTWRTGETGALPPAMAALLTTAALGSSPRPVDPMDRAIGALARACEQAAEAAEPLRTYPLRPELLAFIQVWPDPAGGVVLAAKGAPEAILQLCGLDGDGRQAIETATTALAGEGLRVLGVASCRRPADGPEEPQALRFAFEGLVGFLDPVRADVREAIAEAGRAGISVVMITGDYPVTAAAVARAAGIDLGGGTATGQELRALDAAGVQALMRTTRVFARISPEQKLALVEAAKANGEVVAMTGDGINDAPALEASHVGVAMGQRGTDVAREAADIVLLDDRFTSIVGGVRLGRRIFANLRKALVYITAVHVPIAGLAVLPVALGLPPVLFPAHVVLLELIIDPVCSLVFESEPSDRTAMQRPPRPASQSLFGPAQMAFGALQGLIALAAVMGLYFWALRDGLPEPQVRAIAFLGLVASNFAMALADAAEPSAKVFDRRHALFWGIAAAGAVVMAGILVTPPLAAIFLVEPPGAAAACVAVVVGVAAGGWVGLAKRLRLLGRR